MKLVHRAAAGGGVDSGSGGVAVGAESERAGGEAGAG